MADRVGIAVVGAAGRMGREVIGVVRDDPEAFLAAAVEIDGHGALGSDAGCDGVKLRSAADAEGDVAGCQAVIAFTDAAGAVRATEIAVGARKALVIGSTGLDEGQQAAVDSAAHQVAVVAEPNMSVGVNAMCRIVGDAAAMLGGWDAEILELHHRHKVDAPSGTAVRLFETVDAARGGSSKAVLGRAGKAGARREGEVGCAVMRGGDAAGEHTVLLAGEGERIEITHRASSRRIFAAGAVFAAKAVAGRRAGRYRLGDLLPEIPA